MCSDIQTTNYKPQTTNSKPQTPNNKLQTPNNILQPDPFGPAATPALFSSPATEAVLSDWASSHILTILQVDNASKNCRAIETTRYYETDPSSGLFIVLCLIVIIQKIVKIVNTFLTYSLESYTKFTFFIRFYQFITKRKAGFQAARVLSQVVICV